MGFNKAEVTASIADLKDKLALANARLVHGFDKPVYVLVIKGCSMSLASTDKHLHLEAIKPVPSLTFATGQYAQKVASDWNKALDDAQRKAGCTLDVVNMETYLACALLVWENVLAIYEKLLPTLKAD